MWGFNHMRRRLAWPRHFNRVEVWVMKPSPFSLYQARKLGSYLYVLGVYMCHLFVRQYCVFLFFYLSYAFRIWSYVLDSKSIYIYIFQMKADNPQWICICCYGHIDKYNVWHVILRGRRGRDRLVVAFTTTYAISAYHHWWCEFEFRSGWGVQHYLMKFVSDFRHVRGFLRFPLPIKLTVTI